MSETNAAVAFGEEVGGPVNLLEQHGSLIGIATDPAVAEVAPPSKRNTSAKPEENDGSSHAGLADETAPATEKVIAQLAEAAAEVASEGEAAAVMGALSHTPGVNKSKIAPDVLSRLLPDDEAVVLPQVSSVSGGIGYRAIKRTFEVVSCAIALAILAIPMGIVALKLRMESPGPAVFSQTRVGKGGRNFELYKFRSMYVDAEVRGAQWATEEDPRVTPFGRKLRDSRIDELPQFWNVLKGDMSLIGPRPERPVFSEQFARRIDGWNQRLLVKPGITGLAQVTGGYELLPKEKALYDLEYIENRNMQLDVKIVISTIVIIFTGKGAR